MERIRRRIAARVAAGGAPPQDWDPLAPCTAVFAAAALDKDFWDEHVSERASGMGGVGAMGEGVTADAAGMCTPEKLVQFRV